VVLPDSRRVSRVPRYLGGAHCSLINNGYGTLTLSGAAFQPTSTVLIINRRVSRNSLAHSHDPQTTTGGPLTWLGFRLSPFRSPLLRTSRLLSFRPGTEMFQFPGCPPASYVFTDGSPGITRRGLPHSDISGSSPACGSPLRFVARHVLPRP
jgi:hypothetical protein